MSAQLDHSSPEFAPKTCWCLDCIAHRIEPVQAEPDPVRAAIEEAWDQHDANKLLADLFLASEQQGVAIV